MNLNKVFLLGNLTADPELRTTPNGQSVCTFRMATNRIWVDRNTGEKRQKVEYHRVVAWGKLANIASQYLAKGRLVFVEGRLATRTWEDASSNKRSRTEIIAENLQLGPRTIRQTGEQKEITEAPEEEIPIIEESEDIDTGEIPL
jgi:single-strand DNA-binding protein